VSGACIWRTCAHFATVSCPTRPSLSREEFDRHQLAYDAIVRNIELLGEAARKIPEEVRAQAPDVEWPKIIALRNILVHGYFGLDDDILWDVVQNRANTLRSALHTLEKKLS